MFSYLEPDQTDKEGAFLPRLIFDRLTQSSIILGRSNLNDVDGATIISSFNKLSRNHAQVSIFNGEVFIKPTALNKGIIVVNDKAIPNGQDFLLKTGDRISLLGNLNEWNYKFKDGLPLDVMLNLVKDNNKTNFVTPFKMSESEMSTSEGIIFYSSNNEILIYLIFHQIYLIQKIS